MDNELIARLENGIEYDDNDVQSAALCAWKEARGDGEEAMEAVLHVITNRVGHPGFGHTVHDVIYGKNQFTSMSVPTDGEFNLEPRGADTRFAFCLSIVRGVFDGTNADETNGAHYYDNPKTATSGWFQRVIVNDPAHHQLLSTIGQQNFYF